MWLFCVIVYFIVFIVIVLIGFYDLYKNVFIFKVIVVCLCGLFFEWIEFWEMILWFKYFGIMLML